MTGLSRFSLEGRVALVTGASRGIGGGIALALAEAGADVTLVGREMDSLEEQVKRVESIGRKALAFSLDVAATSRLGEMVAATIEHFGRLDILVNTAGAIVRKPILEATEADFDRVIDVNLKGVYFASQAAARVMIAQQQADPTRPRGKIINIASLTSQIAFPNIASYGASRSGVLGLTRAMAVEWHEHISVNAIAPGYIRTQQTEALFHNEKWVERTLSRIPMGRTGEVDDVTGFAVMLASSASDYMTGQVIFVDGGWLAAG